MPKRHALAHIRLIMKTFTYQGGRDCKGQNVHFVGKQNVLTCKITCYDQHFVCIKQFFNNMFTVIHTCLLPLFSLSIGW